MSRTLSAGAIQASFDADTSTAWIGLLSISHDDLSAPIRLCPSDVAETEVDSVMGVNSRGNFYASCPYQIEMPADTDSTPPVVSLTVENISREIVEAVRSISSPPTVTLEIVLLSDPDTVEMGPWEMTLRAVDYDAITVTGNLQFEDILNEPYPGDKFTPSVCPGLF